MPDEKLLQDNVEEPEPPDTVVAVSEHDSPVELVLTTRVTVPLKPFRGLIVIIEFPELPTVCVRSVGFADIPKSCSM